MPYVHFIIELAIIAAGGAVIWFAFKLARWEEDDDYRRLERKAHRNLMDQTGGWDA